jgi:hypothetical protein
MIASRDRPLPLGPEHIGWRSLVAMTTSSRSAKSRSARPRISSLAEREPLDALRVWFPRLAEYVRLKHGLGEALHTAATQNVINETYARVAAAVGQLLKAAEQAGRVRSGLDPTDVLVLMGFLWRVGPDELGAYQAERILDIVIQGLQPAEE